MNMIASARLGLKPRLFMRPPEPGHSIVDARRQSAGLIFPIAVATPSMNSSKPLRPHASASGRLMPFAWLRSPSPASRKVLPNCSLPGSLSFAVARYPVKPRSFLRPPSPANAALMPKLPVPGSPSNAVAKHTMKPRPALRLPSPAGPSVMPTVPMPGSFFPTAVANCLMKPTSRLRPPAVAKTIVKPRIGLRSPSPAKTVLVPTEALPGSPF